MGQTDDVHRHQILGTPVDDVNLNAALDRIGQWLAAADNELKHVVTVNPEFVVAARRNAQFQAVLKRSSLATADGIGIPVAARILGLPIRSRATGVDLVEGIARAGIDNCRLFLLGASEGVAAQAATALATMFPSVAIAGTFSGTSADDGFDDIRNRLKESNATVLLVAFGHPKQDLWIDRHRTDLAAIGVQVAIGVGGAFDYLSGRVPRAPRLMRRLGLEWLYRLVRQPWRWRRQLALPLFVILVIRERFRQLRRKTSEMS